MNSPLIITPLIIKRPPLYICFLLALGFLLTEPSLAHAGDPDHWQSSYELEAEGKIVEARSELEKVSRHAKKSYTYHLRRGWLLYLEGRYDDSISSYEEAVRSKPDAVEPLLGKALPQLALRLWKDALQSLDAVLDADPDNPTALRRKAWALYNLGRYEDSKQVYARVLTLYPSDVEMRAGLGWTLYKLGRTQEAAAAFEEVLAIAPNHASAREGKLAIGD